MKKDNHHLNESSRTDIRAKRRKTNKLLNSMIVLVLLLIIFVSSKIFFNDDEKESENKVETVSSTVQSESDDKSSMTDSKKENKKEDTNDEIKESKKKEKSDENKSNNEATEDINEEQIVTEGGNSPEVMKTIVNPAWEPIGTSQPAGPSQDYNKNSVDWQENVQAITYATEMDESNMEIWFLGNNGPKKSVATIEQKDTKRIYRVYVEWVDGEGWKPALVEELTHIPGR